jgi:hypothetical protein
MATKKDPFPLPAAEATLRIAELQREVAKLARESSNILALLTSAPQSQSVAITALPHPFLRPRIPIPVSLFSGGNRSTPLWSARILELRLEARAMSREKAVEKLLRALVDLYLEIERRNDPTSERWLLLQQLIERWLPPEEIPANAPSQSTPAPTFDQWVALNIPDHRKRAWRDGAYARFTGSSYCKYRLESSLLDWRAGFDAMAQYLRSGGKIRCHCCGQVFPEQSS